MANEVWQAIVKDWRTVFAGKRDQISESSRVRSNNQGKAGRKESGQAVRRATKTHSPEGRAI